MTTWSRKFRKPAATSRLCAMLLVSVMAVSATASARVLHAFGGGADGSMPQAQLIRGGDGALYGTTADGGSGSFCNNGNAGCGTVFKVTPRGTETVLYAFGGASDGASPLSNLVMGASGNLYGTTVKGGLGAGVVFKLAPDGTETVLYAFQGAPDGWGPTGNVVADAGGNLYGTTEAGGITGGGECQSLGCGTVFKVAQDGTETLLHMFQGGSDGYLPLGGVILDNEGNLYGTTVGGGGTGCNGSGCGILFEVTPDGAETVLYSFQGGSDGAGPEDSPILDAARNLLGTTIEGGPSDRGTVYKLAPDGTETVLYAFSYGDDGFYPLAGLVEDGRGDLYGTTSYGGGTSCRTGGCGTVFELTAKGHEKVLYDFRNTHGRYPSAALVLGTHGQLYGTTLTGGKNNNGVVFELKK